MNVALLVFAYDRPVHLKKVLTGIANNSMKPDKVFFFHDALSDRGSLSGWEQSNILIKKFDWCDKEVITFDKNKGLAEALVFGINYAFETFDAVIVLEDDCVPAPNFIHFMIQCFEKYISDKRIFSVGGYAWPIGITSKNGEDIYFSGRISSWGWGTWRDRWRNYKRDDRLYLRLSSSIEGSKDLAMWANDSRHTIMGNVVGTTNSWAHYWALMVIENKGLCISPYLSLIQNIGNDGSGVHCDSTNKYDVDMDNRENALVVFPNEVMIREETREGFSELYGGYTARNKESINDNVIIYGLGTYFFSKERDIANRYYIKGFVDNVRRGYYAGRRIIRGDELTSSVVGRDMILIMIRDFNESVRLGGELIFKGVAKKYQIVIGCMYYGLYGDVIKDFYYDDKGNWEVEGCDGKHYKNGLLQSSFFIVER